MPLKLVLLVNCVWFGLAFVCFAVLSKKYIGLVVKKGKIDTATYEGMTWTIKFLGGMNLPIAILSAVMLLNPQLFPEQAQVKMLLIFFSMAHGSQIIMNVPVAINEAQGKPHHWSVLSGSMLGIFIGDGLFCAANAAVAYNLDWSKASLRS